MAPGESEWQTRKRRIDTRLRALGWKVIPYKQGLDTSKLDAVALEEYPTANGPADYALFVRGQFLGIIEAKKVTVNPQNVLEQAKRYALGATDGPGNWDGYRVPFLYASNGELVWHLDTRSHKRISRQVSDYHAPTALTELFKRQIGPAFDWFLDTPIDRITRLRPYPLWRTTIRPCGSNSCCSSSMPDRSPWNALKKSSLAIPTVIPILSTSRVLLTSTTM